VADIPMELIKQLREMSGAGMMDCKNALVEAEGDLQKAFTILCEKGIAKAGKRAGRATGQGVVEAYLHNTGDGYPPQVGVLVEVNCETDFVARTEAFQDLVKDLGMQVAAANPAYVAREDVPGEVVEKEREIYRGQLADQKKPVQVVDKIIEGKLEKFYTEQCLLEQPFIKDTTGKTKVRDLVDGVNAKTGERIAVKRFARFQVGEAE